MAIVFIDESLTNIPNIQKLAVGVFIFEISNKQTYPDFLGHFSDFNESPQAKTAQIFKLHFIKPDEKGILKWGRTKNGFNRTSDNFVVYTRHIFFDDLYKIIGIVTPEAHKKMRENQNLLNSFIEKAEAFHQERRNELLKLPHISMETLNNKPPK